MDLDRALQQFDRTEANLHQLEQVAEQLGSLVPEGIVFPGDSPEGRQHNELRRRFTELVDALPALDGYRIDAQPLSLDDIAQWRMEAFQASIPESLIDLERHLAAPQEATAEYRHRFERLRRRLTREQLQHLVERVDELLGAIRSRNPQKSGSVGEDPQWPQLCDAVAQIRRLLGGQTTGHSWADLARHLSFAEAVDLKDIAERDWPAVRADIESKLYADDEPRPVETEDLASVVAQHPTGPVATALAWDRLDDDEGFERLVFNLLRDAPGYRNPQWLTNTRAPDRGRDLSVERDLDDALGGSRHERVVVQCKHWRSRSVRPVDAREAVAQVEGWQPTFDALVIATSGRFTSDAVNWIEQHNRAHRLQVEMWPDSRLEALLATRPWLVEQLELRVAHGSSQP